MTDWNDPESDPLGDVMDAARRVRDRTHEQIIEELARDDRRQIVRVVDPTDEELEALRFEVNGRVDVREVPREFR